MTVLDRLKLLIVLVFLGLYGFLLLLLQDLFLFVR